MLPLVRVGAAVSADVPHSQPPMGKSTVPCGLRSGTVDRKDGRAQA